MSKKFKFTVLSFLSAALLSGCFPTGEELFLTSEDSEDIEEIESAISKIDAENENLIIDLDIPENVPEKVNKFKVHWKEWDTERLNEMFVEGIDNIELAEDTKNDDGTLNCRAYRSDTGYNVCYGSGGLLWVEMGEPYGSYYYFSLSEGVRNTLPLEDYFNDENAELFTKTEAVTRAKKLLEEAGFGENIGEPFVYALTAEKANVYLFEKYAGDFDKEGNEVVIPTWTANEEAYVMEFPMVFNDIPLSAYSLSGTVMGSSAESSPTYITMVVGKDCVPLLWCMGIIDNEYEIVGEAAINVSPQNALKLVAERYDGLSVPGRITKICGCRLVYAPSEQADENTLVLNPFWEFDIRYDYGKELESVSATYVNAQTGMVL